MQVVAFDFAAKQEQTIPETGWNSISATGPFYWITASSAESTPMQTLLTRLGWRTASQRSLFAAFQIGTPVVLAGLVFVGHNVFYPDTGNVWVGPLFGLVERAAAGGQSKRRAEAARRRPRRTPRRPPASHAPRSASLPRGASAMSRSPCRPRPGRGRLCDGG